MFAENFSTVKEGLEEFGARTCFDEWLQLGYITYYLYRLVNTAGQTDGNKHVSTVACWAMCVISAWITWPHARLLLRDPLARVWQIFYKYFEQVKMLHEPSSTMPDHHLATKLDVGLSREEVKARRRIYGTTSLTPDGNLAAASTLESNVVAIFSIVLRHWLDLLVLSVLLAWRIYALHHRLAEITHHDLPSVIPGGEQKVIVVRESKKTAVPLRELVPGDIVAISENGPLPVGSRPIIPADCRLLHLDRPVITDQSTIVSESLTVNKRCGDTVYYGSLWVDGDALALVLVTARNSFAGLSLRSMALQKRSMTGGPAYQKETLYTSAGSLQVTRAMCSLSLLSLVLSIGTFWTSRFESSNWAMALLALTIINQPMTMSIITNGTRSSGAARMAKMGAILQHFGDGVDLLAGIDTLCCDKTGSMSQNKLHLGKPFCFNCNEDDAMLAANLCMPVDKSHLDPIDGAFWKEIDQYSKVKAQLNNYQQLKFSPFDVVTKMVTSVVSSTDGSQWRFARGAPKAVLNLAKSQMNRADIDAVKFEAASNARAGNRTLAVARRNETSDEPWQFLGLIPLDDPPRPETSAAVSRGRQLGIDIKMMSGDAVVIAEKHAKDYSISGGDIVVAREVLGETAVEQQQSLEPILNAKGYAEVFPEHKLQILEALQQHGRIVALTGDSMNDAAILKRAHCGIAVEGAVEDAQATADIVFLKPGLERMTANVEASRQIFYKRWVYCIWRTATALYLSAALRWLDLRRGSDLVSLAGSMIVMDLIGMYLAQIESSVCPSTPRRWKVWPFLRGVAAVLVLLISATIVAGSVSIFRGLPSTGIEAAIAMSIGLLATSGYYCTVMYGGLFGMW